MYRQLVPHFFFVCCSGLAEKKQTNKKKQQLVLVSIRVYLTVITSILIMQFLDYGVFISTTRICLVSLIILIWF